MMHIPAFAAPPPPARPKPRGYWADNANLTRELHLFAQQHSLSTRMPTARHLLSSGRVDLCRAIQRYGGFTHNARILGWRPVRCPHPRRTLSALRQALVHLAALHSLPPWEMPSASRLRALDRNDLVADVIAAGGFARVAHQLALIPRRPRSPPHPAPPPAPALSPSTRKSLHYWRDWRNVETHLIHFAKQHCDGYMPMQHHFIRARRTDLLNAVRIHGGLIRVARRVALPSPPGKSSKRPRGYWTDPAVLHAQLLLFTAQNGCTGLMPRRDQLLKAGRPDIAYAIEKHGGYSSVAARLHLVWHGPHTFWRHFRNLQSRLMAYMKSNHMANVIPSVQRLHKDGRIDLVYGIAAHGGIMHVANRIGLRVSYEQRQPAYWEQPRNIHNELQQVLQILLPLASATFSFSSTAHCMPSSVSLVQMGRADLANAIRDHGGWVYYAQRSGLLFAREVRPQGFWNSQTNVLIELKDYVLKRYGCWEYPGLKSDTATTSNNNNMLTTPALDMLKRDGRSDIAFAIVRYHGGLSAFAAANNLYIAPHVVHVKPVEELGQWHIFALELRQWIDQHGSNGIMPDKQDFIRTGRHDLRYATYKHGGAAVIAQRLKLVFAHHAVHRWLPAWLGTQAGKLGLLMRMMDKTRLTRSGEAARAKFQSDLDSSVVGRHRQLLTTPMQNVVHQTQRSAHVRRRRGIARTGRIGIPKNVYGKTNEQGARQMSKHNLHALRRRYSHLPPDDIITV